MKRKRNDRIERRRTMAEIDLMHEDKPRTPHLPRMSRRGCAQLFGQVLIVVVVLVGAVHLGLL
jgi:hypothetical protein